ncbi:MAG TPA: protein kinase [Candidatus Acidoferrales bacterium]|nr:protein kinase [Candidatus Acidoferrales bacterium]
MLAQTFSHFRILDKLGSGGMGVVYRAEDTSLGRTVALKFLPAERAKDKSVLERFKQEARTASALNHPNICTIYEIGEDSGEIYIAMEYIEGQILRERVGQDGMPVDAVIRFGRQIASALEHAHQRGVVHRDLKLANIMATTQGDAKVLDFGLARRLEELDLTRTSLAEAPLETTVGLAGTLPYMAPELLEGKAAGPRSDLWALGVVLYEMATGCRPFAGGNFFQLSTAIMKQPVPPLPQDVPPGLRAVILKCLEKEPARRYQRAGEVLAALEALGSGTEDLSATFSGAAPQALAAPAAGKRARWLRRLTPVWTLAIVLGVVFWVTRPSRPPHIRSIAVLPLTNLSRDPDQEIFADGMTEELINALSKISALRVISRTSVMQYKGTHKPLSDIARELHADAVVDGTVQRSDGRVKIWASLVDARVDRNLWSKSYDENVAQIASLQSQVAQAIAGEIQVQVTPQESASLSKSRPVNPQAYDTYLRARYYWNKRTPGDLNKAIESFKSAIEIDPTYALAYAGLADSYSLLSVYGELSPRETMPRAKAAAKRALEIDAALAEAQATLANIEWAYDWDAVTAEAEFRKALASNPNYASAHQWYAVYLSNHGRHEEAIAEILRARELDPLSPIIEANTGADYYYARQYDRAIEELKAAAERDPNFWVTHSILGQTYLAMGRTADATAELEKARSLPPESVRTRSMLGRAYAVAGRRAEAQRLVEELLSLSRKRYVSPAFIAIVYVGLGEKDKAFTWLEKAYADRSDWMTLLNTDPLFDPLRSDPRFQDLLRRAGL